jgi:serine/threonine protein kinase
LSQRDAPPWPSDGLPPPEEPLTSTTSTDEILPPSGRGPRPPPPADFPPTDTVVMQSPVASAKRFGGIPTPTTPHVIVRPEAVPNLPQVLAQAGGAPAPPHSGSRPPAPPLPPHPLVVVPPPPSMSSPPSLTVKGLAPPAVPHRPTLPLPGLQQPPAPPMQPPLQQQPPLQPPPGPASLRVDTAGTRPRAATAHIVRSRAYSFVLDAEGIPIEIGSGRSAKAYLGEERWLESKTDFRRDVVIKILQKGVSNEDSMRFQMEKELVERVQGHPNIVHLFASGESDDPEFIPPSIRDKIECEFMILERLEMSLEERLKGSRQKGKRDDLLAVEGRERIFRVLDYMIPIASAIEYAHLVRNVCHRDLKPANVLIRLPNPNLRGSTLEVRLADFNVAKVQDEDVNFQMTRAHMQAVPGTLFFQSPEQETNVLELLVNVTHGSPEVEFFEDFYIQIEKNDTFVLFNHNETYPILYADRARKKVMLGTPYLGQSESSVRAKVQKSVGRPADIYSIGALFYYLISGAYANPKTLYDNFHKFIEYERADELNTIQAYLDHEYSVINSLRAPKSEQGVDVAPADRFFSYKHYLDGNGDLIDRHVMSIIAKCMIRNKPDSYCQAHDIDTHGISDVVRDMIDLYTVFGLHPSAQPATLGRLARSSTSRRALTRSIKSFGNRLWWAWLGFLQSMKRKR